MNINILGNLHFLASDASKSPSPGLCVHVILIKLNRCLKKKKKKVLAKNLIIKSTDLQEFLPNLLIFSVRREKLPLIALSADGPTINSRLHSQSAF